MRLQEIGGDLAQIRHLEEEAFAAIADDSWHMLIGLRNRISHDYQHIGLEAIWLLITRDLPAFAGAIKPFLAS